MLSSPTSAEHMGRSSLAPITTSSSTPARSTVHTDSVIGCTPKKLARDLVLYCRDPVNARMPIEACCMVAVGTVGRPSCYCLVKEEAAFGMSPLFNVSNMLHLLARCGASIDLNRSVNNPCDRPYHDKESAECASPQMTPKTGTCNTAKISAYVAWVAVAVLAGFLAWIVFCQPALATQVVYVPDIQMVRPIEKHNEDQGPRTSDASAGDARGNDSCSDTKSQASEGDVSQTSENPLLDVSQQAS